MSTGSATIQVPRAGRGRVGWWTPNGVAPEMGGAALVRAIQRVCRSIAVVEFNGELGVGRGGVALLCAGGPSSEGACPLVAHAPAVLPGQLGDASFNADRGTSCAIVAGAMANGISSAKMVEALGRARLLGFFGSAGLEPSRVEAAICRIQKSLGNGPYGFNLIHSPAEPELEAAIVDLYLRRNVRLISASAYLKLTLPLVRYRVHGIRRDAQGLVVTPNSIMAKVSRVEVARRFLSPPPTDMLRELVGAGEISEEQARLAATVPMADDLTAEADSGGHTDNRPALALVPTMLALRDELQAEHGYARPVRVGAAGGIATPNSAAAAFALGAAYVMTGSVNQACIEAGMSQTVREMLSEAGPADMVMAPAADMFEMGVRVQVLKWGTMFAARARKLYSLYRQYESLEEIPARQRATLERDYFRRPFGEVWADTQRYFAGRDSGQVARAERDPKHKMALVFRSYLGQTSRWAIDGDPTRKADYQIWCGPAIGAFNEWAAGSFLASVEGREVVTVAMNLMVGAAALTRAAWLRTQGVPLPAEALRFTPRPLPELEGLLQ